MPKNLLRSLFFNRKRNCRCIKNINKAGGNIAQIFISSPEGRGIKKRTDDELKVYEIIKENNEIYGYTSYVLNYAKPFTELVGG